MRSDDSVRSDVKRIWGEPTLKFMGGRWLPGAGTQIDRAAAIGV